MYSSLLFLNIGGQEMIFIFVIALFLFGGKKLPELARGLGKGIREFKDASENIKRDINDQINDFEKAADRPSIPAQKSIPETASPSSDPTANDNATKPANTPLDQPDISHSDQYYQQNYDYVAPEEYTSQDNNDTPDSINNSEPVENLPEPVENLEESDLNKK